MYRFLMVVAFSWQFPLGAQSRPAPILDAAIDLVIGGPDESRDDYLIHATSGLYLDAAGRIYVGEAKGGTVRIFSPTGRLITRFGRIGQGPGDLAQPGAFTTDRKGLLWIADSRNRRFSAFETSGSRPVFVTSVTVPSGTGAPYTRAAWDADGNMVHMSTRAGAHGPERTRVILRPDGTIVRELPVPTVVDATPVARLSKPIPGGPTGATAQITFGQPYGGTVWIASSANGDIVAAHSSEYSIKWYDKNLRLIRTVGRKVIPPKVTAAERDTAEQMLVDRARDYGVSRGSLGMKVPSTKPPVDRIDFDHSGRLWVQLSVPDGAQSAADIYDPSGRLQARVRWPANIELFQLVAMDSVAIGIARDDDGAPSIVRLKFRPAHVGRRE